MWDTKEALVATGDKGLVMTVERTDLSAAARSTESFEPGPFRTNLASLSLHVLKRDAE